MNTFSNLVQAVIALFIVIDPLGNLPVFMGLTCKLSAKQRRSAFIEALYVGFLLLLLFTLAGSWILSLFMINLNDFKIAGGILLLVISIFMLNGNLSQAYDGEDVGAVPLGCPLLVGPGAITTAMVLIGMYGVGFVLIAVLINFILSGIILLCGDKINDLLGKTGSHIIARVFAILLAAIAVKFIREGIVNLFRFYV